MEDSTLKLNASTDEKKLDEKEWLISQLNARVLEAGYFATRHYRTGFAGIIEFGTEVDVEAVKKELTPEILKPISILVVWICRVFNVAHPSEGDVENSFKKWYIQNIEMDEYPDFIFEMINKT